MLCSEAFLRNLRRLPAMSDRRIEILLPPLDFRQQMQTPEIHAAFFIATAFPHLKCLSDKALRLVVCLLSFVKLADCRQRIRIGCIPSVRNRTAQCLRRLIALQSLLRLAHAFIQRPHRHVARRNLRIFLAQKLLLPLQSLFAQRKCLFKFLLAAVIHTEVAQRIRIKNMLLPQHPLHNLQNLPMHLQRSVILPVLTAQRRQRIQAVDEIQMLLAHQPSADFHRLFAVFHRQIQ